MLIHSLKHFLKDFHTLIFHYLWIFVVFSEALTLFPLKESDCSTLWKMFFLFLVFGAKKQVLVSGLFPSLSLSLTRVSVFGLTLSERRGLCFCWYWEPCERRVHAVRTPCERGGVRADSVPPRLSYHRDNKLFSERQSFLTVSAQEKSLIVNQTLIKLHAVKK